MKSKTSRTASRVRFAILMLAFTGVSSAAAFAQSVVRKLDQTTGVDGYGARVDGGGELDGLPGDDFIVGSPFDGPAGQVSAYSGSTGTEMWRLFGTSSSQRFGITVRILPDIDGDGLNDVAIASLLVPTGTQGYGDIQIVSGLTANLIRQWTGTASNFYGPALAPAGDVDGDGKCDLLVGCPEEADAGPESGCLRVLSTGTGAQLHQLNGFANDNLGRAVAGNFDANGDGVLDFIVTAQRNYLASNFAGYARVYSGANLAVLKNVFGPFSGGVSSGFGWSLDLVDDMNSDGRKDYVVGAPSDSTVASSSGLVRAFSGSNGAVLWNSYGQSSGEMHGYTVRGMGDADLDGVDEIITAGKTGPSGTSGTRLISGATGATIFAQFGYATSEPSIGPCGDTDLDGVVEFIVGEEDAVVPPPTGHGRIWVISTACLPAVVYCNAKFNSQGCLPTIGGAGLSTLSGQDDFHIFSDQLLNNKPALLIYGSNPNDTPFFGGTLCVKGPVNRIGFVSTGGNPPPNDCSGALDFHWSHAFMLSKNMQPGQQKYAQFWYRDPGFAFPNNVGLSPGLWFAIGL